MAKLLMVQITGIAILFFLSCSNQTQNTDTGHQNNPDGSVFDSSYEIPTADMGGVFTRRSTESKPSDNGYTLDSRSDQIGDETNDSELPYGSGFADYPEETDESDTLIPTDNDEQPSLQPPCITHPSQVVALGDSYVSWPVFLMPKIAELAVDNGALQPGETYRDYSFPGTVMGTSVFPILGTIPPQWELAKQDDKDIKVVITDGGGNDIIFSVQCLAPESDQNPACIDIVHNVMDVTRTLQQDLIDTGVTDVIFFLYPNIPLGGYDILNYATEEGAKLCKEMTTDTFRCHLIDTRPAFEDHPEYFGIDPIHPNEQGAWVVAQLIWETMQTNCIAQPVSSGCCIP